VDPEISLEEEDKEKDPKPVSPKRRTIWRKVGFSFLFILATAAFFAAGYFAVILWQHYFTGSFLAGPNPYENWLVYRSENYDLGLRYPDNWEATEVSASFVTLHQKPQQEGEVLPKDYVSLAVAPNAKRGKTACENDQSACSFYANEIYGEQIVTPESEIIFFAKGENDFTLTWAKYGEADYTAIFEEMGKSLRFVTPDENDAQNP
jgi:hypothetical protein